MERAQTMKENFKSMPHAAERTLNEAREIGSEGLEYIKDSLDEIRANAKSAMKTSERTIRENPFYAVLGAAAVGVVIGALLRRSRD